MKTVLSVDMKRRNDVGVITFFDDIGSGESEMTAKAFGEKLKALGEVRKVEVLINSLGGSLFHGIPMYNALRDLAAKGVEVVTVCQGFALSMASYIFLAGDRREIVANGFVMLHKPRGKVEGSADDYRAAADLHDKLTATMTATYAARSGQSAESITAMMEAETWLSADEAIAKGFATHKGNELELAATFDVEQFRNMPTDIKALCASAEGGTVPGDLKMSASVKEIREECPNCSDKFILSMLEKGATIEGVKTAFIVELRKPQKKSGTPVIEVGMDAFGFEGRTYRDAWNAKLTELAAKGIPMVRAVGIVARENPDLREAMVAEANVA